MSKGYRPLAGRSARLGFLSRYRASNHQGAMITAERPLGTLQAQAYTGFGESNRRIRHRHRSALQQGVASPRPRDLHQGSGTLHRPVRGCRGASQNLQAPGGPLFRKILFLTRYHGHAGSRSGAHDDYPDYWRFTHQGFHKLFARLGAVEVAPLDGPIEFKLRSTPLVRWVNHFPMRMMLDRFDRPRPGKPATRHIVTGRRPAELDGRPPDAG